MAIEMVPSDNQRGSGYYDTIAVDRPPTHAIRSPDGFARDGFPIRLILEHENILLIPTYSPSKATIHMDTIIHL